MNQPNKIDPTDKHVSTVTKSIKLYSDNPIHDCIDRIIENCAGFDEQNDHSFFYSLSLKAAAEELCELAYQLAARETDKYSKGIHNEKPAKTKH